MAKFVWNWFQPLALELLFQMVAPPLKLVAWTDARPHNRTIVFQPFFSRQIRCFLCKSFGFVVPFPRLFFVLRGLQTRSRASGILPEGAGGGTCERFVEGGGFNQAYLGGRCPASSVGDYDVEKSTPSALESFHQKWGQLSSRCCLLPVNTWPLSLSLWKVGIYNMTLIGYHSCHCNALIDIWYMISALTTATTVMDCCG